MKIAIIYATNNGCTDKCAHTLATNFENDITLFNVENKSNIIINDYEIIIIGGSIIAGSINKRIRKFINENLSILTGKKLGLFICCMFEGKKATVQFDNAFPIELKNKATAHGYFGGEFDFNKMNSFEKAIIKKVANIEHSESRINYDNINSFAKKMLK